MRPFGTWEGLYQATEAVKLQGRGSIGLCADLLIKKKQAQEISYVGRN